MSKHPIGTLTWWQAASIRALKTAAQTAVALIGTGAAGLLDVDWLAILWAAALAAILSLLTSLAGLPELTESKYVARYAARADPVSQSVKLIDETERQGG